MSSHSIWLMPSAEHLSFLAGIVDRLAAQFGTPAFCPHLTLVEDMPRPADELAALLDGHFGECSGFSSAVSGVAGLPLYYRSLFAAFEPTDRLRDLKERAVSVFGAGDVASFMPHISLAYGVAEERKREAITGLAAEITGRLIRFDSIAVVASAQSIPVADWKIASSHPLT